MVACPQRLEPDSFPIRAQPSATFALVLSQIGLPRPSASNGTSNQLGKDEKEEEVRRNTVPLTIVGYEPRDHRAYGARLAPATTRRRAARGGYPHVPTSRCAHIQFSRDY
jgi:hypothetical protein